MSRALALLLLLGGCNDMVRQPRYDEYETAALFPNHMVLQHPPAGTVARDALVRAVLTQKPAMSLGLVERGRARFEIYCAPCHGLSGDGDGMIVARGFPRPPSYHSQRLRDASDAHFYHVIVDGYGVMYPYGERIAPPDRWAITAYIRALQKAREERGDAT